MPEVSTQAGKSRKKAPGRVAQGKKLGAQVRACFANKPQTPLRPGQVRRVRKRK